MRENIPLKINRIYLCVLVFFKKMMNCSMHDKYLFSVDHFTIDYQPLP